MLAFLEEKAEFRTGMFINEYTPCSFTAPTAVVGELVEVLSSQGRLSVTVRFARIKDKDISFTTGQRDSKNISVAVNLDYKDIALEQLILTVKQSQSADARNAAPKE